MGYIITWIIRQPVWLLPPISVDSFHPCKFWNIPMSTCVYCRIKLNWHLVFLQDSVCCQMEIASKLARRSSCSLSLRKKFPYSRVSGSHFPAFGLNADQKNSKYGRFLRSTYKDTKLKFEPGRLVEILYIVAHPFQFYLTVQFSFICMNCDSWPGPFLSSFSSSLKDLFFHFCLSQITLWLFLTSIHSLPSFNSSFHEFKMPWFSHENLFFSFGGTNVLKISIRYLNLKAAFNQS